MDHIQNLELSWGCNAEME